MNMENNTIYKISLLFTVLLMGRVSFGQAHSNDNLSYNNGALLTVQSGCLITVQGDFTTNGNAQAGTHLDNNGFIWIQGNMYGDNAFKHTGTGIVRLQNKTALYTAPYATEAYQVIQGGYRVNGGSAAIAGTDDGSFATLELDNSNGQVFTKTNTDVRTKVDFKPAAVTVDGATISPNGKPNRIITCDPGTAASPAAAPANGASYPAVFGVMNTAGGLGSFGNVSANLITNTTVLDSAYIQGKLRRAISSTAGGTYGFPIGLEPSNSNTDTRGIQYAIVQTTTAGSYDVITGYFQRRSDNTVASPGNVCSLSGGFVYYGSSNHGEWVFTPNTAATDPYRLTIYPQDYGSTTSVRYFITKDNTIPSPGVQSCGTSPEGLYCSNITGFSEFGFAGANIILPVKGLTLEAKLVQQNNVAISWKVLEEVNVDRYEVEHATTGTRYNTIGIKQAGNNLTYGFVHNNASNGINYYRIKAVDNNGEITYSPVKTVTITKAGMVNIYPSPATNYINIAVSAWLQNKPAIITIMSTDGKMVLQKSVSALRGIEQINTQQFTTGTYVLKIVVANEVITQKIDVIR